MIESKNNCIKNIQIEFSCTLKNKKLLILLPRIIYKCYNGGITMKNVAFHQFSVLNR